MATPIAEPYDRRVTVTSGTVAASTPAPPREPGRIRRFAAAHPRTIDWIVVVVALLPQIANTLQILLTEPVPPSPLTSAALVVTTAAPFALLWRRRLPLVPFGVALLALAIGRLAQMESSTILFALFALGAFMRQWYAWVGLGVAAVVFGLTNTGDDISFGADTETGEGTTFYLTGIVPLLLVATVLGVWSGSRRTYISALLDYSGALARERERLALLAAAEERARIAREMHDLVGHSLTVVVTLADGAIAQAGRDPQAAVSTMGVLADTARGSLTELRSVLDVISPNDDEPGLKSSPSAGDIARLVEEVRHAGLPIERAVVTGVVPNAKVGLAVHRIVQESLTNMMKHGRDVRSVVIEVAYGERSMVRVDSDGAPAYRREGGRGELGMRSRAMALGGSLMSAPRPEGGWSVTAELPAQVQQGER